MAESAEQLLVLGAGLYDDGTPSPQTIKRAERARELFEERPLTQVVFSGGYPRLAPETWRGSSEAEIMADIATGAGLSMDLVDVETESATMLTNFINSAPLLGPEGVIVVTHRIQKPRAEYTGGRILLNNLVVEAIGEPADPKREKQEQRLTTYTQIALAGMSRGALTSAKVRNFAFFELPTKPFRLVLRATILRNHTSLGSPIDEAA